MTPKTAYNVLQAITMGMILLGAFHFGGLWGVLLATGLLYHRWATALHK